MVATVDNRPALLTCEGVLEETNLRLRNERGSCRDRRFSTWVSGGRINSAKENYWREVKVGGTAAYRTDSFIQIN